LQKLE
jgi:hypothetical protein